MSRQIMESTETGKWREILRILTGVSFGVKKNVGLL